MNCPNLVSGANDCTCAENSKKRRRPSNVSQNSPQRKRISVVQPMAQHDAGIADENYNQQSPRRKYPKEKNESIGVCLCSPLATSSSPSNSSTPSPSGPTNDEEDDTIISSSTDSSNSSSGDSNNSNDPSHSSTSSIPTGPTNDEYDISSLSFILSGYMPEEEADAMAKEISSLLSSNGFDTNLLPSATNLGLPEGDIIPDMARAIAIAWFIELNKSKYYEGCEYTDNNTSELIYCIHWAMYLKEGGLALPIILGLCGTPSGVDLTKGGKNTCAEIHDACDSVIGANNILRPLAGYIQTDPNAKVPVPVFNARLSDIICLLSSREPGAKREGCPHFTKIEAWIKAAEINILVWLCNKLGIPTIVIPVGGTSTGMGLLVEQLDRGNITFMPSKLLPHMQYFAKGGLVCEQLADGVQMLNDVIERCKESQNLEMAPQVPPPRLVDIVNVDTVRKRSEWGKIAQQIGTKRKKIIDSINSKEKRTQEEEDMLQNWTLGQHSRTFKSPAVRKIMANIEQKKKDERTFEEKEMLALYYMYDSKRSSIVGIEEVEGEEINSAKDDFALGCEELLAGDDFEVGCEELLLDSENDFEVGREEPLLGLKDFGLGFELLLLESGDGCEVGCEEPLVGLLLDFGDDSELGLRVDGEEETELHTAAAAAAGLPANVDASQKSYTVAVEFEVKSDKELMDMLSEANRPGNWNQKKHSKLATLLAKRSLQLKMEIFKS